MNKADDNIRRVLVEVDCLLDTRIATLENMGADVADKVLRNGYLKRDRDDYGILSDGLITHDDFLDAYVSRDQTVLKRARPTHIIDLLREIVDELDTQKSTTPFVDRTIVYINVYPYRLSEDEKNVMTLAIGHFLTKETWVEITSISPMELTPSVIGEKYDGVIIYNFDGWFIEHAKTLDTVIIPQNKMYAPAFFVKEYTAQEQQELEEELKALNIGTPFEYLERAVASRLDLELLRAELFSVKESFVIEK